MSAPPDPDEPEQPGTPSVRPYLSGGVSTGPPPVAESADGPATGDRTMDLRPFIMTAGRVEAPDPDIGMETQVTAHPGAQPTSLPRELREIVTLCVDPLSVAEISARLRMHLGVTRILVGDLRAAGQLDVHVLENEFPDPETILRVIRGLRAIS